MRGRPLALPLFFKIQRRERVRLSEVTAERLMTIEGDVLYEIVA